MTSTSPVSTASAAFNHTNSPALEVRKTLHVNAPLDHAFEVFTAQMTSWWPLGEHAVTDAASCHIEPKVGGRLYEVSKTGEEALWGTVTIWDAPHHIAFSWHPGRNPELAMQVDITFQDVNGGTELTLVHQGFERHEQPQDAFEAYDPGWDYVLGCYLKVI